jgi:PAS domain S-box-containing protein
MEKRYVRKDGEVVWADLTMFVAPTAEGAPDHLVAIIQELTARKRVEEALRASEASYRRAAQQLLESEQRYRSLFEHHPHAVYSVDLEGRFVSANPTCEAVAGYAPEELLGQPFDPVVVPEHREVTRRHFAAALAGVGQNYVIGIFHKSGRRIDLEITNIPIVVDGAVVGVYGIARDLTAQRSLEAQLQQAQKMEAVGRLAGGIAHDFNNLLTAILTHTELILSDLPGGQTREDAALIRETAQRATALTRQLLAFSRKQVARPQVVDLNEVIRATRRLLRRTLGEEVVVETYLTGTRVTVQADPSQLEQVLLNLAVNARDAMPQGGRLTLRTDVAVLDEEAAQKHGGLPAGAYVVVAVEDSGIGMSREVQEHIFEPFFTTKGVGKGTGLGLSTVYGIVKQIGGAIDVASAPGAGTTFTVFVPRYLGTTHAGDDAVAVSPPGGHETILVVEDESTVRSSVRRILARHGYTVLEARHGAEALRLMETRPAPPDAEAVRLVVTDLVMPEMGGHDLIASLRVRPDAPRLLVMSGYDEHAAVEGEALPADIPFLEKPFTVEGLLRAVRAALDAGRERPAE